MVRKINMTEADIIAAASGKSANFRRALAFVLPQEGMYWELVAGDSGGETEVGVTHFDYDAWRKEHALPLQPLRHMTAVEVADIYHDHYWDPCHCDDLGYGLALSLFDAAVNVGTSRAVRWLQAILGTSLDGVFGPATLAAAKRFTLAHDTLADGLNARRVAFYNEIGAPGKTNHKFLAGWLNRIAALKKIA